MKKAFWTFLLTGVLTFSFLGISDAQGEQENRYRLEAKFSYEYLSPRSVYGSWKTLNLEFYNKLRRDLTYFVQLGAFSRDEGDAVLGSIGAYKDWADRLYTYSAVSGGTNSDYLPRFRIDNDFNFKLTEKKNLVWLFGVSYIKYFDVHKDFILSTGLTYYIDKWILGYRVFRNDSDPGDVTSYSHLGNVGYGTEGWQWTFLTLSYGKQAYLATNLTSPEEIRRNAFYVTFKHRQWIRDGYGATIELGYFKLEDGYKKYTIYPGIFLEF
jgi:YaiO family outer membrane protein